MNKVERPEELAGVISFSLSMRRTRVKLARAGRLRAQSAALENNLSHAAFICKKQKNIIKSGMPKKKEIGKFSSQRNLTTISARQGTVWSDDPHEFLSPAGWRTSRAESSSRKQSNAGPRICEKLIPAKGATDTKATKKTDTSQKSRGFGADRFIKDIPSHEVNTFGSYSSK
ncbi:unnamed protein product [Dovyalis caffra]|uniref:Uncharacterized protein n=1 Tax=Dovyalis caffra TaxID=77055 RepID=A0AAV1SAU8_9ROSI|nr:unnamed protein product [Dovyalis caffra]